jgi:hypothetical protein
LRYSVDPKSRELAEHFLPDGAPEDVKRGLAQAIQDAVEGYLLTPEERAEAVSDVPLCGVHGPNIEPECQDCHRAFSGSSDQLGDERGD